MQTIYKVLSPVAESGVELNLMAPRLGTLAGKTIGLLDNTKEHSRIFLDIMKETLEARIANLTVTRYRKTAASSVEPELLKKVAEECDGAIHGIGD
ncbi:hypothetical protein ACFLTG_00190 [Chloroflexota bacterium]